MVFACKIASCNFTTCQYLSPVQMPYHAAVREWKMIYIWWLPKSLTVTVDCWICCALCNLVSIFIIYFYIGGYIYNFHFQIRLVFLIHGTIVLYSFYCYFVSYNSVLFLWLLCIQFSIIEIIHVEQYWSIQPRLRALIQFP